jgi:alkanesulfonate monooxygenase SsuD/methylene tetrahydromethanopterin reductase-like flavin-dependent oxidoreductase (luciferase family)
MKIGLLLNTQSPAGVDMRSRVPDLIEQVRTARESGFSSLWFPQHYLTAPMQMFQASAVMPYMMAEAKGMTIGGDIIILPLHNPVAVAEEAATLDVLSGGNYVLGVGLGYREEEFTAFGIPMSERVPRFTESLALIRKLWSEDRVDHQGRFYRVANAGLGIKPIRREGIPVWIAAQVDAAIKRAAALGDSWLIIPSMSIGELQSSVRLYREALREHGKPEPAEFPITRECYVGASQASAMEDCREALAYKYAAYARWGLEGQQGDEKSAFDSMARDCFIIGDKGFVKEEIARYRETLGVNHFIMRLHWPGFPQDRVLRSIRALGEIFA